MAGLSFQTYSQRHRRGIGAASSQSSDILPVINTLETGYNDDVIVFKLLYYSRRIDTQYAGLIVISSVFIPACAPLKLIAL
jgi:hypothetical protein